MQAEPTHLSVLDAEKNGTQLVYLGFDHQDRDDGTFIPNGVVPEVWRGLTESDLENHLPGVDFRHSRLWHFVEMAGVRVKRAHVAHNLASSNTWYYPLRPYGVPDLTSAFSRMEPNVRPEIESGKCYLLIDYAHEGFSSWMFYRVYEALSQIEFRRDRVMLIGGDLNIESSHTQYIEEHGICAPIRVLPLNYFQPLIAEHMASENFRAAHLTWQQVEQKRTRDKLYLNFNRRNRFHRLLVVVRLQKLGLLERGYVSLPDQFEGQTNERAIENEGIRFQVAPTMMRELLADYQQLSPLLPLRVDVDEMRTNHAYTHPTWPYLESWLSLVSESLFFESTPGQIFFSEKIWKPMMNYHPFLLIGDANSLAMLRQLGFRTFEPYINEVYDAVADHEKRLAMVLTELFRISQMPEKTRYDWFMGMRDILIHNFKHLQTVNFVQAFRLRDSQTNRAVVSSAATTQAVSGMKTKEGGRM